jgi:tRNA U34 5-methylaminomethyl-2-thiouridine-forming methyltransferase MnmC
MHAEHRASELEWHDGDMPYSVRFGDHFYARSDGRAECGHVFIAGNRLVERWRMAGEFTIAELGFGTGLNFLETWRQWREAEKMPGARLRFVSFERYPLLAPDMARALKVWPQLRPCRETFLDAWPEDLEGTISLGFGPDVELEVHIGEADDRVTGWSGIADAWFLDGFAPSRNPQMWSQKLLQSVFDRTVPGGTLATYTAAGWVRRNLAAAGFDVEKRPGFAGKRDMTVGLRPTSA